jgi:hypothetical protein
MIDCSQKKGHTIRDKAKERRGEREKLIPCIFLHPLLAPTTIYSIVCEGVCPATLPFIPALVF